MIDNKQILNDTVYYIFEAYMNQFVATVTEHLQAVNWEGPAAFVIVLIAVFAVLRKWSLALLVILTIVLGWGAQDMIVLNMNTEDKIISVPFLVYIVGSGAVVALSFVSLFRSK